MSKTFSRVRSILETSLSVFMLVVITLFTGFIVYSFSLAYPLPFAMIFLASLAIVVFYRYRRRLSRRSVDRELHWTHRGILMNKFSPAGIPGLAFVLGAAFIFWFGVPGYRPIVIGVFLAGVVIGIILIVWRR
jgi:hypothetical protein